MKSLTVSSPAKINLFLAVTGRRPDGFHDLVSLVARLSWGDRLTVVEDDRDDFRLECTDPAVPADGGNLVLRAAEAFRAASGRRTGARFLLEKRIPMGAGLGGGSGNAAATLRALNTLAGERLSPATLEGLAAGLGSDCVLFLQDTPVVMRGRGDRVGPPADPGLPGRLRGRKLLVFKPGFGVPTPGAYAALARAGEYVPEAEAEAGLAEWMRDGGQRLFNSFERVVFDRYPALPVVLDRLRGLGLDPLMTGSGSACFAFLDGRDPAEARALIRAAWGPSALIVETTLA